MSKGSITVVDADRMKYTPSDEEEPRTRDPEIPSRSREQLIAFKLTCGRSIHHDHESQSIPRLK